MAKAIYFENEDTFKGIQSYQMEKFSDNEEACLFELHKILEKMKNLIKYNLLMTAPLAGVNTTFITFLRQYNIRLDVSNKFMYMHPAIIFAALGTEHEILYHKNVMNLDTEGGKHEVMILQTDKFGINLMSDKTSVMDFPVDIKIKFNDNYDEFKRTNNLDITLRLNRHPQLRKIISNYCEKYDINFNEKRLFNKLKELNGYNPIYNFYDAEEQLALITPEGTYFSILPKELKEIILNKIKLMIDKKKTAVPVLNRMIESLIGSQVNAFDNGNADIGKIFAGFKQEGILEDIKSDESLTSVENIDDFVNSMGGITNLAKSLFSSIRDSLEKTADENE